jgi:hypothetical protein
MHSLISQSLSRAAESRVDPRARERLGSGGDAEHSAASWERARARDGNAERGCGRNGEAYRATTAMRTAGIVARRSAGAGAMARPRGR